MTLPSLSQVSFEACLVLPAGLCCLSAFSGMGEEAVTVYKRPWRWRIPSVANFSFSVPLSLGSLSPL